MHFEVRRSVARGQRELEACRQGENLEASIFDEHWNLKERDREKLPRGAPSGPISGVVRQAAGAPLRSESSGEDFVLFFGPPSKRHLK